MLKHIIYTGLLIVGFFCLSSCEKVVDIKLGTSPNQIVIEGTITDQPGQQTIKISQSVPYTESNAYPPVTGAVVTVSDDAGHSWNFTETKSGSYTFGPLKGEAGRTYKLSVNTNSKIYKASSTMPVHIPIDSLTFKTFTFGGDGAKFAELHYKDPAGTDNQYRYVMKVNGTQIKSVFAENDRFTNGNIVRSVLFYDSDNDTELKKGDMVEVEMQCIDENIFTYWYTFSQQAQRGPGGGVTPGNPPSNIDNNALGYFSAQTSEIKKRSVD